jgi:YVTN family beta-propeller protein
MPITIVVAPDSRRAWATAVPSNELIALDLVNMKVTARVAVGAAPDGLAVRLDAPRLKRRAAKS